MVEYFMPGVEAEFSKNSVAKHSLYAWGVLGVTPQNSTMDKFKFAGQNLSGVFNCGSECIYFALELQS